MMDRATGKLVRDETDTPLERLFDELKKVCNVAYFLAKPHLAKTSAVRPKCFFSACACSRHKSPSLDFVSALSAAWAHCATSRQRPATSAQESNRRGGGSTKKGGSDL